MINYDTLNPSLIAMHNSEILFSIISSNVNCKITRDINLYIKDIN